MSLLAAEDAPGLQVVTGVGRAVPETWRKRAHAARQDRRQYERQWQINQHFAAGNQHLLWSPHDGRVIANTALKDRDGRPLRTADVLGQYLQTAVGKIGGDDLRPQLLLYHDDEESEQFGDFVNDAFGWGWENEWDADRKLRRLLRILAVVGTGAIRCKYDRQQGNLLSREIPHDQTGRPILDEAQQRSYVVDQQRQGLSANLKSLREGKVAWDVLDGWNLLTPPGIEEPDDFPWEFVVQAVPVDAARDVYGAAARNLTAEPVTAMSLLGNQGDSGADLTASPSTASGRLDDHLLLYTGYQKPTAASPDGVTVVFAGDTLLDQQPELPYTDERGARAGVTYFRWTVVPKRFWGRGFIEPGIDPQRVRNKRLAQVDETIDKGQPKIFAEEGLKIRTTGVPLEIIEVPRGSQLPQQDGGIAPGGWMTTDIEQQDANVQKALGLSDVQLGQPPTGVSAYSAMAMLSENDAQKLGPVAQEFRAGIGRLAVDTLEAMRNWGSRKTMLLAGEDGRVGRAVFDATKIPVWYQVKPAAGSVLPRSQGAQIQKIADLWAAALVAGAVAQQPGDWLNWYQQSYDAGKPQELPRSFGFEQRHKAALENVVMARTGQPVPVADYDDPEIHIPLHDSQESELQAALEQGDTQAAAGLMAIEQHKQMHLQQAQQNQAVTQPAAAPLAAAGGQAATPSPAANLLRLAQQPAPASRPA